MGVPFEPIEPNPFRVNAFTLTGVSQSEVSPLEIRQVATRLQQDVVAGHGPEIPLAGEGVHRPAAVDLVGIEDRLRDPELRMREELLVASDREPLRVQGARDYMERHALTPRAADARIQAITVDLRPLALAFLSEAPDAWRAPDRVGIPPPPLLPCPVGALLVSRRHRYV